MHIVCFQGGFANQLFQLCLYLRLKELYKDDVVADLSLYEIVKDHGGYKLDRFIQLDTTDITYDGKMVLVTEDDFDNALLDKSDNDRYYRGYWQSTRFFPKDLTIVKNIFNTIELEGKNKEYSEHIDACNSVALHVRRGDYVNNPVHGNIANGLYYNNAIKYMTKEVADAAFFVFSDNIEWCKKHLCFEADTKVEYITGNDNDVHLDMHLMSRCKHNIISNSSFSWWAQWLNLNPDKLVVSPSYWFNDDAYTNSLLEVEGARYVSNVPVGIERCEKPVFSFVVFTGDNVNKLRRCLTSILNQRVKNIEVILLIDKDNSRIEQVADEYCANDKRIIKCLTSNKTLPERCKEGVEVAIGEYMLFLDVDTHYSESFCEKLKDKLDNDTDVIFLPQKEVLSYKENWTETDYYTGDNNASGRLLQSVNILERYMEGICVSRMIVSQAIEELDAFSGHMLYGLYLRLVLNSLAQKRKQLDSIEVYSAYFCDYKKMSIPEWKAEAENINNAYVHIAEFLNRQSLNVVPDIAMSRNKAFNQLIELSKVKVDNINDRLDIFSYVYDLQQSDNNALLSGIKKCVHLMKMRLGYIRIKLRA